MGGGGTEREGKTADEEREVKGRRDGDGRGGHGEGVGECT